MRSKFKSHIAGSGMNLAFYEFEDTYRDLKVGAVRFPHDKDIRTRYDELCGKVVHKRIEDLNIGIG